MSIAKPQVEFENFKSYNGNPLLKRSSVNIKWTPDIIAEYVKCSQDPIYFCRTYMKIVNVDRGLIPFELYDYQVDMMNAMVNESRVIITTSRQAGKSTTTCAFILWYVLFSESKTVALLANKGETAREILGKIQLAYQHLPKWLQQGVVEWNKGSFELENGSRVIAAATSSDSIRGYSINLLFIDECVTGDTIITVKNKKTQIINKVEIKSIYGDNTNDFEVLTERGFKNFSGIKKSIKDKFFHISFDDGTELKCSYEHRVKKNDIFVRAYELTVGEFVQGKRITDIQLINEEVEVFDLLDVEDTHSYITNDITSHNCAFVENFDVFFTSTYPTISSGETTKVILVSTPKGLNHHYHIWTNAVSGRNGYKPIMVRWAQVPGRNEKWKQDTLASLNFDMEKFNQEYECEFLGSSGTLIAGWRLKQLEATIPIHTNNGLSVFEHPVNGHVYVCVADVSRGKGLDHSAFSIIDVSTMPYKQVCTYRNNFITPIDYAEIIYRIAKSYNRAAVLVEINDIGEQISTSLQFDFEYDNLLYTEHAGRGGKKISAGFGPNADKGIRTTKTVKSVGCSILKLLIEQSQIVINDKYTISELSTFSKKGVSYEAEPGNNDDMVMGLVLFSWLSDQAYFKDLTDINTLARLRDKSEDDIENELLPFGFIDDGRDDDDIIDMSNPPRSWMFSSDERF